MQAIQWSIFKKKAMFKQNSKLPDPFHSNVERTTSNRLYLWKCHRLCWLLTTLRQESPFIRHALSAGVRFYSVAPSRTSSACLFFLFYRSPFLPVIFYRCPWPLSWPSSLFPFQTLSPKQRLAPSDPRQDGALVIHLCFCCHTVNLADDCSCSYNFLPVISFL